MKPLPSDPLAFQARVIDTLCDDIRDTDQPGFARLDALRGVSIETCPLCFEPIKRCRCDG